MQGATVPGATVSGKLVEICDSLRKLALCVLHLKRTMGIVNITIRNDTATLAHGDRTTLTMCCMISQEQQP